MCGIAGSVGPYDLRHFRDSLELIDHRGPDNQSILALPNIILGHTRLSIRDLSVRSNQPIRSDSGNILVYNGEIYNCEQLIQQLSRINVDVESGSDTKLLLSCLENFGIENTLARIDGMYAFSYYDVSANLLYLCRDHLGIKPLYFSYTDGAALHFASSLECVASLRRPVFGSTGQLPQIPSQDIDPRAITSYLSNGYPGLSHTWLKNISELPPGHCITFDIDRSKLNIAKWFDLPKLYYGAFASYKNQSLLAKTSHLGNRQLSELNSTLETVVHEHCLSDVGCGLFLSGGLDSSLLASYVPSEANHTAFSIRYSNDPFGDEVALASRVADKFGIDLIVAEYDLFDYNLDACVKRMLEITKYPFYNITILAQDFLCAMARSEGCKVVLAGDGADELFGGYPRYQATLYHEIVRRACFENRFLLDIFSKSIDGVASLMSLKKGSHAGRRLKSFSESLSKSAHELHSLYLTNIPSESIPDSSWDPSYADFIYSEEFSAMPLHCSSLIADMISFLPWNLLKSSDLSSMYNEIEMRVPFCDRRLLPLSAAMCRNSIGIRDTKIPLRALAQQRGLSFLASHKKRGFSPPLRLLIDSNYAAISQCFADYSFFSNFVTPDYLLHLQKSQFVKGRDFSKQIFSLYMLKYWWDSIVVS